MFVFTSELHFPPVVLQMWTWAIFETAFVLHSSTFWYPWTDVQMPNSTLSLEPLFSKNQPRRRGRKTSKQGRSEKFRKLRRGQGALQANRRGSSEQPLLSATCPGNSNITVYVMEEGGQNRTVMAHLFAASLKCTLNVKFFLRMMLDVHYWLHYYHSVLITISMFYIS